MRRISRELVSTFLLIVITCLPVLASSHSEAPLISMDRYPDKPDTDALPTTRPGGQGVVSLIANYIPFQEPSGGPQWYRFDDTGLYEIKIDNTADGVEDTTYQLESTTQTVTADTL